MSSRLIYPAGERASPPSPPSPPLDTFHRGPSPAPQPKVLTHLPRLEGQHLRLHWMPWRGPPADRGPETPCPPFSHAGSNSNTAPLCRTRHQTAVSRGIEGQESGGASRVIHALGFSPQREDARPLTQLQWPASRLLTVGGRMSGIMPQTIVILGPARMALHLFGWVCWAEVCSLPVLELGDDGSRTFLVRFPS